MFLCIVLSVIIAFTGIFVDMARICAANAEADEALESSVKSMFARYNSTLKEQYGLFALFQNDKSELQSEIQRYLDGNLTVPGDERNLLDLYGFKIDNVDVNVGESLAESSVLSRQILKYMQLRAPKELITEFATNMGILKKLPKSTEVLDQKIDADKEMSEIEDIKTKLALEIEKVNKFKSGILSLEEAARSIDKAIAYISQADQIAKGYKTKSDGLNSLLDGDCIPELANAVRSEIQQNIKRLSGENYSVLKQKLSTNNAVLNTIREAYSKDPVDQAAIARGLNEYSYIEGYNVAASGEKRNDPRDASKRYISSDASGDELKVPEVQNNSTIQSFNSKKNTLTSQKEAKTDTQFDFDEKKGDFTHQTLKQAGSFLSPIAKAFEGLQENLYTDEYILGTFKNFLSDKQSEADLRGEPKKNRDTFFKKGEVEYILTGYPDENKSLSKVKSRLTLIRLTLNFMYLYTDREKYEEALAAAAIIAGWTGFGVPVVHAGIMIGWATAEATNDVKRLLAGEKTPLFKTRDTWAMSLYGAEAASENYENKKGVLWMDYKDYLRVLLLQTSKEQKLRYTKDLIELNMQQKDSSFTLSNCNTYVSAQASITMKYIYVTSVIMPGRLKGLTRHIFKMKAEYRY